MMTTTHWLALGFFVLCLQRLSEIRMAKNHERIARAQGAIEYGRKHYPLFFLLHGSWMLCWLLEGLWVNTLSTYWPYLLVLVATAEILRYWAIRSLGTAWNTKILIIPSQPSTSAGPYRWLKHPNYVAVIIEIAAVPLIFGAWRTALIFSVANMALLGFIRIPSENRALRQLKPPSKHS